MLMTHTSTQITAITCADMNPDHFNDLKDNGMQSKTMSSEQSPRQQAILLRYCMQKHSTFDRKVPKSSSFFFRGVISSTVSAMASLSAVQDQRSLQFLREASFDRTQHTISCICIESSCLILPMAVFWPEPTTTALPLPAVTTVPW